MNIIHVSYFFDHLLFIPDSFENLLIINNSLLELPIWFLVEFKCILVDVVEFCDSISFVLGIGNDNLGLDMGHDAFNCWELNRIPTVGAVCCWWDDCKFCMIDVWKSVWQSDVCCAFLGDENGESCLDKKDVDGEQLGMVVLKPKVDNTSGNVSSIFVCKLSLLYVLFAIVGSKI